MLIQPTYLAHRTTISKSPAEARRRAIQLYRDFQRSAPEIQSMYLLNIPISLLRSKIRQEFERNRFVTDPRAIDVLLFKGRAEFQETMNYWKQKCHVMAFFELGDAEPSVMPSSSSAASYERLIEDSGSKSKDTSSDFMKKFLANQP